VATCAEVSVDSGHRPRCRCYGWCRRLSAARLLNPDHLKNQVEGAMMMGAGRCAVRGNRVRRRQDQERQLLALSSASFSAIRRSSKTVLLDHRDQTSIGAGGDADRRGSAGHRQTRFSRRREFVYGSLPMAPHGREGINRGPVGTGGSPVHCNRGQGSGSASVARNRASLAGSERTDRKRPMCEVGRPIRGNCLTG